MWDAAYFREKAAQCRKLAALVVNPEVKEQLLTFAREFDEDAATAYPKQRGGSTK
jgi:hypothetical protein